MKSERDHANLGMILVTALTSLLAACADLDGAADEPAPSDPQASSDLFVAPPAPDGASTPAEDDKGAISSFVPSPTISPSDSAPGADVQFAAPGGTYNCAGGTLCAGVWDPNVGQWKVFKLFFCATYSLSNWFGSGFYLDRQTPGTVTIFYGQSHNVLTSFIPDGQQHPYNWDPVWFIKNC